MAENQPEFRHLVRIANTDLNGNKCNTLLLHVSSDKPGKHEGVTVESPSALLMSIVQDDGSSACYQSCIGSTLATPSGTCSNNMEALTTPGSNVLTYGPTNVASCQPKFYDNGTLSEAALQLKLVPSGSVSSETRFNINVVVDEGSTCPISCYTDPHTGTTSCHPYCGDTNTTDGGGDCPEGHTCHDGGDDHTGGHTGDEGSAH